MTDTTLHPSLATRRTFALSAASPYWILRLGAALCFIGHGAFGFITKAAWVPYFAVVGIPESWAWRLMPWVGAVDVLAGMSVLFAPTRLPLVYMSIWALWTALLRPLSGESVFEFVERAGNYGVPFALLLVCGIGPWREWLAAMPARAGSALRESTLERVLQWTTVLLLAGHGALGAVVVKGGLSQHYASIGLPAGVTPMIGWFELGLALAIAVRPMVGVLLVAVVWKLATESLWLAAGSPVWEVVERAGSYAAPLALAAMIVLRRSGHSAR